MTTRLKIASWNINSVRARIELVERFLADEAPDILCLQETKVADPTFPADMFNRLGYTHQILHGQRMHHGVAILSRIPMREDDRHDWQDNGEARHIGVQLECGIRLENVYIPAGGDIPDPALNPKFGQKLAFIERMTRWSEKLRQPTLLVGDFNIAPLECDVWSHRQLRDVVSHTQVEIDILAGLQASHEWVDLGRRFIPAPERLFTWWSYRATDWAASDRGRRLDHMWASPDVAKLATAHTVHEPCRSWLKPSDHVPLVTEFPDLMSEMRAVAEAIDALRRGWPVHIAGSDGALDLLAIETADDPRLAAFDPGTAAAVLLSGGRAATLKLANQAEAAAPDRPVLVARVPWLDLPAAHALADPALDLLTPLKGPFRAAHCDASDAAAAALILARLAGLLPAFFVRTAASAPEPRKVLSSAVRAYEAPIRLVIAARANLPVAASEKAEIIAFRNADDATEHVALVIGTPDDQPPLVRLHSECLTGDVLGSLKCDCGPQLHAALHEIADARWGILLYLRQEGRGIGLVNKLRAYALQDQGFDTVDANVRLGFAIDARDFGVAARMLTLLGQDAVRLLTNNPAKVAGLEAAGIHVVERVPHHLPPNPHNQAYLATKRDRTGHQL